MANIHAEERVSIDMMTSYFTLSSILFTVFFNPCLHAKNLIPRDLLKELQGGGKVVYFRHTDRGDGVCLTVEGRRDAELIAIKIIQMKIPVDAVYSSPACRNIEFAMLTFRRHPLIEDGLLHGSLDHAEWIKKELLSKPVKAGSNRVLLGHGGSLLDHLGFPYLEEGDAMVVMPKSDGTGYVIEGKVYINSWRDLYIRS